MKLLGTMKKDFQRPGQTLTEFAAEFKALTPEDKKWFAAAYAAEGVVLDDAEDYA